MQRHEQLEDRIHFILSTCIQREFRDRDLGLVTITAVRLNKDRSVARIYYTFLGDSAQNSSFHKAILRASGFLRSHLAKAISMRRVPELQFFLDDTLEQGNKMEELLVNIKEEDSKHDAMGE